MPKLPALVAPLPVRISRLGALLWLSLVLGAGARAATLTRGPYLQLADESGVTVVWRTDSPGVGAVRFGLPGALTGRVVESAATTTHVVRLSGLTASTRYAYALEQDGAPLLAGEDLSFRTYPARGAPEPFRFFAWGDSGDGSVRQARVAQRMQAQVGEPAFALILGDIIYPAGEAENYDPHYFRPYAPLLRRMVIWPTLGNHDVMTAEGAPYLDAFYLPTNNPQATERYYSFDYGNAHFVSLATDGADLSPGSPQLKWAADDLARSNATWKFVFFHRPPYSGGNHPDARDVQAGIVPTLEAANADVVFCGHSHVYERTYLLQNGVVLQPDKASYTKLPSSPGTLYVVSGAGGEYDSLSNPRHPLMATQRGDVNGVLVVDVNGPVARGYFLEPDGAAEDLFTLYKGADVTPPRPLEARAGPGPDHVTFTFDEPVLSGATRGWSAEDIHHYMTSPALIIRDAKLGPDQRTVTLTTEPHKPGKYRLIIEGIGDRAQPTNVLQEARLSYVYDPAQAGAWGQVQPLPAWASWSRALYFAPVGALAVLLLLVSATRAQKRKG